MAEPDAFDPTHALDGWRPAAPAPLQPLIIDVLLQTGAGEIGGAEIRLARTEPEEFDPTHLLDGWRPPAPAPLDLELRSLVRAGRNGPDEAKKARLKARGYEMLDVEDVELPERVAPRIVVAPPLPAMPDLAALPIEEAEPAEAPPVFAEAAVVGPETATAMAELARQPLGEDLALPEGPTAAAVAVDPPEKPQPAGGEAALQAQQSEAIERAVQPVEVPVLELPPVPPPTVGGAPVLDFQVPLPADPDAQQILEDIQLPEVPPPPVVAEAPELDFRASPPPATPDPQQVIEGIMLPKVEHAPAVVEAPVLDLPTVAPRAESEPRLLAQYQPGAWTAVARRLRGASAEVVQTPSGPLVENHAPQWLCALWPPQPAGALWLGRWPELAALVPAETSFGALHQLLAEMPPEARLWPAEMDVDWALVAELVLHRDMGSRPAQAQALRELVEAERRASAAHVDVAYAREGNIARRRT